MTHSNQQPACAEKSYLVNENDLPLCCPTNDMTLWNAHPKVYLTFDSHGVAACPYCGARYILEQKSRGN